MPDNTWSEYEPRLDRPWTTFKLRPDTDYSISIVGDPVVLEFSELHGDNPIHISSENGVPAEFVYTTPDVDAVPFYQAKLTSPDGGEVLSSAILSIRNLENGDDLRFFGGQWSGPIEGSQGNDVIFLDFILTSPRILVAGGVSGDDLIYGTISDDFIYGGPGNDVIKGERSYDDLFGGDGDDLITGDYGHDTLFGGDGNDRLFGGLHNDKLYGDHGDDVLRGDAGRDTLAGHGGGDTLIGGEGNDVLHGGGSGDLLFGGDGADFLNGGFGHDRMNGGAGGDRFFHHGSAGHGSDWIQDYDAAEGDVLIFASAATRDDFQINIAATEGAGTADTGEAFVIHRPTGQIVWALVDGAGQDEINLQIGQQVFDLLA